MRWRWSRRLAVRSPRSPTSAKSWEQQSPTSRRRTRFMVTLDPLVQGSSLWGAHGNCVTSATRKGVMGDDHLLPIDPTWRRVTRPNRPSGRPRRVVRGRHDRVRADVLAVIAAGGMLGASARYGVAQLILPAARRLPVGDVLDEHVRQLPVGPFAHGVARAVPAHPTRPAVPRNRDPGRVHHHVHLPGGDCAADQGRPRPHRHRLWRGQLGRGTRPRLRRHRRRPHRHRPTRNTRHEHAHMGRVPHRRRDRRARSLLARRLGPRPRPRCLPVGHLHRSTSPAASCSACSLGSASTTISARPLAWCSARVASVRTRRSARSHSRPSGSAEEGAVDEAFRYAAASVVVGLAAAAAGLALTAF